MVDYLQNITYSKLALGGISFLNHTIENFLYKIRMSYSPKYNQGGLFKKDLDWKTQLLFSLFPILGPREKYDIAGGDPGKKNNIFNIILNKKILSFFFIKVIIEKDLFRFKKQSISL